MPSSLQCAFLVHFQRTASVAAFVLILFFLICSARSAFAIIQPSQVLVLYNADWQEDHPLTGPGQDSLEVAEYYVRMHADPVTGERPHLLGLSCRRMGTSLLVRDRMLNSDHLEEKSSDNQCGVIIEQEGQKPLSACEFSDGRLVEVVLPQNVEWQWDSLELTLDAPGHPDVPVVARGRSLHPGAVTVQHQGDWNVRLNGHVFFDGFFAARASCLDRDGTEHTWQRQYADARQAVFSPTGADGERDDQLYLECIEEPIKTFLEDPANALPDGTLLKDHILFIVVSYGLPKTVVTPYGIAVGITEQRSNFGTFIDMGQRLQLLYTDFPSLRGIQIQPMRFTSRRGSGSRFTLTDYSLRTPLSQPFFGQQANPFLHPLIYQQSDAHVRKHHVQPLPFSTETRNRLKQHHLFYSMRLDAPDPVLAMELIDRARYAARYAGPEMGVLPEGPELVQDEQRTGRMGNHAPSQQLWEAGYRHLYYQPSGRKRIEVFRLAPETGFFNTDYTFLPGGIATEVESHQGWNRPKSRFIDLLHRGVTATAGAARVYRGAPHIHNRSFWDNGIFYPFLLQGRTLGEVLLMNQIHLGWITTFVGDPLLRFPDAPRKDTNPFPDQVTLSTTPERDPDTGRGKWVMVQLDTNPETLKVAQMRLTSQAPPDNGAADSFQVVNPRFSARPHVFIPAEELRKTSQWLLELIDPFGNTHKRVVDVDEEI